MDYLSDDDLASENSDVSSVSTDSNGEAIEFEEHLEEPNSDALSDREEGPYCEEPLADKEWIQQYNHEREIIEERQQELQNRLERVVEKYTWCKCENCNVELLQNARECECCQEIDGCVQSLSSELVIQEVDCSPSCVTLHPGFSPVCLNRWSLRSAAAKYKTQDDRRYRQTGTDDEFLRVTAYREFTQLIHGYLGPRRIPLPACAYHLIRKEFGTEGGNFTGYEDGE